MLKEAIEDRIKGLILKDVDIIFVKERHLFDRISKINFVKLGGKEIRIILVNDLSDITALSNADMKKLGWNKARKKKVKDDERRDSNDQV